MYVELLRHSAVVVQLEVLFGARGRLHEEDLGGDEQLGMALFGGAAWSMLAVVGGSVAHVSPTLTFNELIVRHSFGPQAGLARAVAMSLVRQGAAQAYKVVGSMEVLGDPVALVSGVGEGVYQFFRKTGADLLGESETTGEGLKDLLQGVVGGTFGSVAKITGAADDLLSKLGGTSSSGSQKVPLSSPCQRAGSSHSPAGLNLRLSRCSPSTRPRHRMTLLATF